MSTTNIENMKTEMVVFLRNSDILTTTQRGVTTTSNVFTATAAQTVFTLSNNVVRNIRYATVDGTTQNVYQDFTPDYKVAGSTLTFTTGLTSGELLDVGFDYSSGTNEKVWSDYPELQYLASSVPRIGFDLTGIRTEPLGIGDTNWFSDALITVKAYDSNLKKIDGYLSTIREKVKAAQRSFYHFQLVRPTAIGPTLLQDLVIKGRNPGKGRLAGKVFERATDLVGRFNFES